MQRNQASLDRKAQAVNAQYSDQRMNVTEIAYGDGHHVIPSRFVSSGAYLCLLSRISRHPIQCGSVGLSVPHFKNDLPSPNLRSTGSKGNNFANATQ